MENECEAEEGAKKYDTDKEQIDAFHSCMRELRAVAFRGIILPG
jgi:hypothetical protein